MLMDEDKCIHGYMHDCPYCCEEKTSVSDSAPAAGSAVAWLHVLDNTEGIEGNEPMRELSFSKDSPFGVPGVDHSKSFKVTTTPLYMAND